ncbi:L-aspartate oxidase [Telmatobacter bradus]|uniref:L-aspartate oxidase n=1 Tax=Telmatobacter bradus TaxID=474953 RepID=UPI003B4339FC
MTQAEQVDFLVMGAGVAGLRAAIELARHGSVLVVTKEAADESNTHYAQGGIAVAMGGAEDVALHIEDTLNAGDGLVDRAAADVLAHEGPLRVAELIEWGANFDSVDGQLHRTREGAHSLPRILHAHGDATGAEIGRALATFARLHKRIRFAEWTRVAALIERDGRIVGADLASAAAQTAADESYRVAARAVLVASGGAGQLYSDTTNPAVATGDGIALAYTAGAALSDLEFYQFHPTAFYHPGAPRFLLSEALRGEGAWLRNDRGERFMEGAHPLAELAPRDVVARAIAREGLDAEGHARPVYLDMHHVTSVNPKQRFPGISDFLSRFGLELSRDLIPVRPAAHYMMGGIRTDLDGRTSLPGLYAAGEAACTGVHGANRLASNSLLEGLVFGARAARAILDDGFPLVSVEAESGPHAPLTEAEAVLVEETIAKLQNALWAGAGLLRSAETLKYAAEAQKEVAHTLQALLEAKKTSRRLSEAVSLNTLAEALLLSAEARTESRGAHFRSDFPARNDQRFARHSVVERGTVRF